jgi:hypothetical protein
MGPLRPFPIGTPLGPAGVLIPDGRFNRTTRSRRVKAGSGQLRRSTYAVTA